MKDLSKEDIELLVRCLTSGKEIPAEYKYALFPTKQREYELVYAGKSRKEDILADNEEAKAVPLQVEKIFNGTKYPLAAKDWHNLLVFGDNLQILKTFYKNEDKLIRNKVRGKVKLIYIDPPFGTGDEYGGRSGQSAYTARRKGADFVEFLRRRLFLLKELLDPTGSIFVRLDYHFGHYIKAILDEVFGPENFRNEIIVRRGAPKAGLSDQFQEMTSLTVSYDNLYWYSNNSDQRFKKFTKPSNDEQKIGWWHGFWKNFDRPTLRYELLGVKISSGQWYWTQQKALEAAENYEEYLAISAKTKESLEQYWERTGKSKKFLKRRKNTIEYWVEPRDVVLLDNNWLDIPGYSFSTGYPTENSEDLLKRIIEFCSDEGDLVMDVFAGSGTSLAVAEKLGRRWIGCDIGKLAIYTAQKRLLEIGESKDPGDPKKDYGKIAKSFGVVASGLYDLGKVFALKKDEYIEFVKRLFEVEETKTKSIGGVSLDGKRREFYVKIFPYWDLKDASVDEKYLQELDKNLGSKIDGRMYVIVPANSVNFISDYHEVNGTRYYFLKVPYQIIKELHKVQFKKLRQPQSKKQINDLDDAIGFHFVRQPEVKSEIKMTKDRIVLKIKKFESAYDQDEAGEKLENFESLAMVLVDLRYNGDQFLMSEYFFAQDLIGEEDDDGRDGEQMRKELEKRKEIVLDFEREKCGKQIMAIYVDIYGNEFREVLKLK